MKSTKYKSLAHTNTCSSPILPLQKQAAIAPMPSKIGAAGLVSCPAHGEIQPYSQVLLQAHSADAVNSPLWHQHSLLILAILTLELQCACLPCIMEELWTVTPCPLSRHTGLLTVSDISLVQLPDGAGRTGKPAVKAGKNLN